MHLSKFKRLFSDEIKELLLPLHIGHLILTRNGILDDDEEINLLDQFSFELELLAIKCLVQDRSLHEKELDTFIEIVTAINIAGERAIMNREGYERLMNNMYKNFISQNSLDYCTAPLSLRIIKAYDDENGSNFASRARHIFFSLALICIKADNKITGEELNFLRNYKKALWEDFGDDFDELAYDIDLKYTNQHTTTKINEINQPDCEKLILKLNSLTGISTVKEEVQRLINTVKVNKLRNEKGLPTTNTNNHIVFYGNPGTGKTTVARLLAGIFKGLGVLKKGHLVEVDRSALVAGYVGQTSIKTRDIIESAFGGILFIDEAYTLAKDGNDYGAEAIDTLLKIMEDHREDFVVIVAGYTEKMTNFLSTNPGLKSRFTRFMNFPDYTPAELVDIFEKMANDAAMTITPEAKKKSSEIFNASYKNRNETFGNARLVRNLINDAMSNQADRIISIPNLTEEILQTITEEDIPDEIATI